MLKTFKTVAGILAGLFCVTFLRMMAERLAHPGVPHQMSRLVIDGGLAAVCGYAAVVLLAGTFRASPATERVADDGTLTVGTTQAQRRGESLVVQVAPKARWNNAVIFGFWAVLLLLGLPTLLHRHAWGWLVFNALGGGFGLLMLCFTLSHWRDSCVWDRTQGQFLRNGTPVCPLADITGIETGKSGSVFSLWYGSATGRKEKIAPTLGVFRNEAEAERLAHEIRHFLKLKPTDVWPPPPTMHIITQAKSR